MSVWFKYSGDKDITPGHPSGSSLFSPPAGGGGGFPAYGTYLGTFYGYDYESGSTNSINSSTYYAQSCDVDYLADGVGGYFIDWTTVTNIVFKAYGTLIVTALGQYPDVGAYTITLPDGQIASQGYWDYADYFNDGWGGYYYTISISASFSYWPNGTFGGTFNEANKTEVPAGSGQYYDNGLVTVYNYFWNGYGAIYTTFNSSYGSAYTAGIEIDSGLRWNSATFHLEVPSSSGNYFDDGTYEISTYTWDGSGGYSISVYGIGGSFYPYGSYIYNDGMSDYYWDGSGGYYT